MDLVEVFKTYLNGDQQGQLVIKFVGEDHLCKISIENGQAIYLTLGALGPHQALEAIVGKAAEWSNFIKGMPARKRLEQPINQLLLNISGATPPTADEIPLAAATETTITATEDLIETGESVPASQVSAIIERFIDLVGPFGAILAEKICGNLAYSDGTEMNAATYTRFITALAAEVPEGDRQGFIADAEH